MLSTKPTDQYRLYEWKIVALAIGILFGLSILSITRGNNPFRHSVYLQPQSPITVHVTGAVEKPGHYITQTYKPVESLLKQAIPTPEAHLTTGLKIKQEKGEWTLHVPNAHYLLVYLDGAISQPGWIRLPNNSRICDISSHLPPGVILNNDVDPKFLKRRKKLQSGERITIQQANAKKSKK